MTETTDERGPLVNVASCGGRLVMLTVEGGYDFGGRTSTQVYLSRREAAELAAAIGHHADLAARGIEADVTLDLTLRRDPAA